MLESISKMRMIGVLLLFVGMMFALPMVMGEQTQQTNKLYLDPFYTTQVNQNTNHSMNLTLEPVDSVMSVQTAIIGVNFYTNEQSNINAWVDGVACNTATFTVRGFATGYVQAHFDCSNVIDGEGDYVVTIKSDKTMYSINAYSDITYTNKPDTSIQVHGTEYQVGDPTTTFIQLLENEYTPVNDASCFVTVYYPDNTVFLQDQLMTYQAGSNGLYYYDNFAQTQVGVYMVEVYCQYETEQENYNATSVTLIEGVYISGNNASVTNSDDNRYVIRETGNPALNGELVGNWKFDETSGTTATDSSSYGNDGTYSGSPNLTITGVSNTGVSFDNTDDYVSVPNSGEYDLNATEEIAICFSINSNGNLQNGDTILDYLDGNIGYEIIGADDEIQFDMDKSATGKKDVTTNYNFVDSNWHTVCFHGNNSHMTSYVDGSFDNSNAQTQSGTADPSTTLYFGADNGLSNHLGADLDELCIITGTSLDISTIAQRYNESKTCGGVLGGLDNRTFDIYVDVPVSTPNGTLDSFLVYTEYQWDDATLSDDVLVYLYNYSGSSWYQLPNDLTFASTDTIVTNTVTENISQFTSVNNTMRVRYHDPVSLESGVHTFRVDQTKIIYNMFLDEIITEIRGGGEIHVSQYNFSKLNTIASDVWGYSPRTLTNFDFDVVNETLIADEVWNYSGNVSSNLLSQFASAIWSFTTRTLTSFGTLVDDIWSNTDRNLTYYEDTTNYTLVQDIVTTYGNDDNTNYTLIQDLIVQYGNDESDLTNYTLIQDLISQYGNDLTAELVWNYTSRNLTFFPAQVDLTNYTLVQDLISQYGNDLTASAIWTHAVRNLTYYENFGDLTNYTLVQEIVTQYGNDDVTNYTLIQDLISQYGNDDVTNYTLIADLITQLGNDDNTNYTLIADLITQLGNDDSTNYTLIQEIVTQYGNDDNTNYTLIGNLVSQYGNDLTAQNIWEYTDRNLTYYEDVTNYTLVQELITNYGNNDVTNYTLISDMVWSATTRTLTDFNFTVNVNNSLIAEAIWTYVDRTLTNYTDTTNYTLIQDLISQYANNITAQDIWTYNNRNLTFYEDVTDYQLISDMVWNATTRTLTELNFTVDVDESLIADAVWNYVERNLTTTADATNYTLIQELVNDYGNQLTAGAIWNYVDRNLTYYPAQVDLTNYSLIQDMVWNATTRTLTDFNFTVTANVNDTAIANAVWNSVNRTLTYYPDQVDLTNYTQIENLVSSYANNITPDDVWTFANRNLTYYEDVTNYNLIQDVVWNATVRTLTDFNFTVEANVNVTEIVDAVWGYVDRQLTTTEDVTNYTLIQQVVWDATNRTLTEFNFEVDVNESAIANAVWSATDRQLTAFGFDVTDEADIWSYTTRELTYYPTTNLTLSNDSIQALGDAVWQYQGNISTNILSQVANQVQCYLSNLLEVNNQEWSIDIKAC